MTKLRLALAQLNPTVGDIPGNYDLVLESARRAHRSGVNLLALPEMMIPGYPIEDLALRHSFASACMDATATLATRLEDEGLGDLTVAVGTLSHTGRTDTPVGTPQNEPRNAAWILSGGQVVARYAKHHLPNYGVFDEYRYFVPGVEPCVVEIGGCRVSLAICEDLWQEGGPVTWTSNADADLLLVLNGSPFEEEKSDVRLDLCRRQAIRSGCALAYVNMVGGQDDLVFGGDSMVVGATGELIGRAKQLEPDFLVADIETNTAIPEDSGRERRRPNSVPRSSSTASTGTTKSAQSPISSGSRSPTASSPTSEASIPAGTSAPQPSAKSGQVKPRLDDIEQVYLALSIGLHDYVVKNGFNSVVLGLSGGIDSALVAAIACDALGADNVVGVSMPSKYSSQHSKDDARETAERNGLAYRVVPIEPMVAAFTDSLTLTGLAEENLQARVRGVILMGLSNSEGHLVLATGNKTELAVGYSTIYGDAVGGFAPIKDVSKTQVWELTRWRNSQADSRGAIAPIPESSITKPPSAELRPDQLDSDSLPDYELLDKVLDAYVEQDRDAANLVSSGFDSQLVQDIIRMTDAAEYKRRQYPPGTKITLKAFGRDRRLPITNRWREDLR